MERLIPGATATRRRTIELLLNAAEDCFIERGYPRTSVDEIAARAGMTRGAFYSNFESKLESLILVWLRTHYTLDAAVGLLADMRSGQFHIDDIDVSEELRFFYDRIPIPSSWLSVETAFLRSAIDEPDIMDRRRGVEDARVRIVQMLVAEVLARVGRVATDTEGLAKSLIAFHDGIMRQRASFTEPSDHEVLASRWQTGLMAITLGNSLLIGD